MIMNLNENTQLEKHPLLALHYVHMHVLVSHHSHIHFLYGLAEIIEKCKYIYVYVYI